MAFPPIWLFRTAGGLQLDADGGSVAAVNLFLEPVLIVGVLRPTVHAVPTRLDRLDQFQVRLLSGLDDRPVEVGQIPHRIVEPAVWLVWLAAGRSIGEGLDLVDDGLSGGLQPLLAVSGGISVSGCVEYRFCPAQIYLMFEGRDPLDAPLVVLIEGDPRGLAAEKVLVFSAGSIEPLCFSFDGAALELDFLNGEVALFATPLGKAPKAAGLVPLLLPMGEALLRVLEVPLAGRHFLFRSAQVVGHVWRPLVQMLAMGRLL